MKKLSMLLLLLFLSINLYAGDVANFMNLGFSSNGEYFLFGEYGVVADFQEAYSNMWLVDVNRNSFVKGGVLSGKYKTVIEPGESAIGGLLKLLDNGRSIISKKNIDFLDQGRPLYIRINDDKDINQLDFRDFTSELRYKVRLEQKHRITSDTSFSSFGIELETINSSDKSIFYNIGNPNYERRDVVDYKIERIIHSSYGDKLVFVISKKIKTGNDEKVRYMVETISLK